MPAVPSQQSTNVARRNSFYGRSRVSSSSGSSSSSHHSSHQRSNSGSSSSVGASSSASSTNKTSSSSAQRSSSPFSKKQAAVAAAANAASKRLLQANAAAAASTGNGSSTSSSKGPKIPSISVESLRREAVSSATLDEPEYQLDVIEHMHRMETDTVPCVDLMDAQPELRWYMRPYLVDFIVEIHQTFRLRPETLFLTMNIVDRYVSKRIVYKRHYQLVGCAALLIAAKFEDAKDKVPLVSELAQMCCSAYDESAFVQMEGHVLSTIGWILGFPTPEAWLRLACATANDATSKEENVLSTVSQANLDAKTLNMARFMLEASLFTREFIGLSPSHLTAGCLLLAQVVADNGENREQITAAASSKALSVAQMVDAYMIEHAHELSEILIKKYSFSHFCAASTAVVQWYTAFVAQREAQQTTSSHSSIPTLLPAVSFSSALNTATAAPSSCAMVKSSSSSSSSSFSTPRRSAEDVQDDEDEEDVDEDESMLIRSRSTTPSSVISTPSQMSTDGEEEDEDEDDDDADCTLDEDDEESDMPVTPLSLNSLHDPLVAAESTKENGGAGQGVVKKVVTNVRASAAVAKVASAAAAVAAAEQRLQPRDDRRALSLSQQDNRLLI